jgi:hypothetical protein
MVIESGGGLNVEITVSYRSCTPPKNPIGEDAPESVLHWLDIEIASLNDKARETTEQTIPYRIVCYTFLSESRICIHWVMVTGRSTVTSDGTKSKKYDCPFYGWDDGDIIQLRRQLGIPFRPRQDCEDILRKKENHGTVRKRREWNGRLGSIQVVESKIVRAQRLEVDRAATMAATFRCDDGPNFGPWNVPGYGKENKKERLFRRRLVPPNVRDGWVCELSASGGDSRDRRTRRWWSFSAPIVSTITCVENLLDDASWYLYMLHLRGPTLSGLCRMGENLEEEKWMLPIFSRRTIIVTHDQMNQSSSTCCVLRINPSLRSSHE